jgi:Arc/MetJ-type ribon-helix-helix transcriptional regulator
MARMKTVTVRLPDELVDDIEEESRATQRSKSDVIRERLQSPGKSAKQAVDPLASIRDLIGSVDGLPPDLGSRYKHYLRTTGYGRKRHR